MTDLRFKALVLRQQDKQLSVSVEELGLQELPAGEVLVRVAYSSLNYKDAMALGNRGIIRNFPAVPGIDFAGTVVQSGNPAYAEGDQVVLTGWGVGERFWGGLSQYARVPGDFLVPLPAGMTLRQAMAIGTAGLTAMLSVLALERQGLTPADGPVLVTGATGGVGTVAVALLAQLGYEVVAMSGKPEQAGFLKALGASSLVDRDAYAVPGKPGRFILEPETFAAAVDSIGGATLASILARLKYGGSVAACGLVGGVEFDTHVFPFILRGVNLLGIDSVRCPQRTRLAAWQRLARDLQAPVLAGITREIGLDQVLAEARKMLQGQACGRVVVALGSF